MSKRLLILLPLLCLAGAPANPSASSRFTYVDIMIDPKGESLAAWQFEFTAEVGQISLVGVEAGDNPAYAKRPPYYDPAALAGNRIIVGNYSLDAGVPKTRTRVARLMLEIRGDAKPQYVTKLMAAANADGTTIPVELTLVEE
jgi:hypothetical protein